MTFFFLLKPKRRGHWQAGSGGGSAETPAPTANGGASKPPENGPKAAEAGAKGQEGDAEAAPKKKVYNKVCTECRIGCDT